MFNIRQSWLRHIKIFHTDRIDHKTALVQVMAWRQQESSHYLNQRWQCSTPPYSATWSHNKYCCIIKSVNVIHKKIISCEYDIHNEIVSLCKIFVNIAKSSSCRNLYRFLSRMSVNWKHGMIANVIDAEHPRSYPREACEGVNWIEFAAFLWNENSWNISHARGPFVWHDLTEIRKWLRNDTF